MQIYLVGGAVRDGLLQLPVYDRDWVVVGATPEEMLAQGYRQVGKDFPVFLHPTSNEEYALARTERKISEGHTGFSVYSAPEVSLEEDLMRRDITINAIAQDQHGVLIDPYHGQDDLQQQLIRHISPAFSEDPLRVLRVARFAAKLAHLGFKIATETLTLMASIVNSGELKSLSRERIWQETSRALATQNPEIYFTSLLQIGALHEFAPAFADTLYAKKDIAFLSALNKFENTEHRYIALMFFTATTNGVHTNIPCEKICASFAAPKLLTESSQLVIKYYKTSEDALSTTSDRILDLLKSMDALRRTERCIALFNCMHDLHQIINQHTNRAFDFLIAVTSEVATVKLDDETQKNLSGKEIGKAIDEQRCQLIEKLCNAYR